MLVGCDDSKNEYVAPPPSTVTVARPVEQTVTPFLESSGRTEAAAEAQVNARVTGIIQEVRFAAGQDVMAGDVLYQIEPDDYQAALDSAAAMISAAEAAIGVAEAMVATAEAEKEKAAMDLKRQRTLQEKNAGSQADLDKAIAANASAIAAEQSALAQVRAAKAEKERAEAQYARAKLDLGYTTVTAPISGRITKTAVKQGNLVDAGTKLATIVATKPIYANFTVSDRDLLRFIEAKRKNGELEEQSREEWRQIPVYLSREVDQGFPFEGKLDYVSAEGIDPTTGTLALRAVFDNQARSLVPGLFVIVRLPKQETFEASLVPEYAVSRDQRGKFVLTVDDENTVLRTDVVVRRSVSGWSLIESGIDQQSRVIIDGLQKAIPGQTVSPTEKTLQVSDRELLRGASPQTRTSPQTNQPEPATAPSPVSDSESQ
jgi:RND family efflux transporter MFP subunit